MRNGIIGVLFYTMAMGIASAVDIIAPYVGNYAKVGQGTLTFAFIKVYDATLYAPNGVWDKAKPFALTLQYAMRISGEKIAQQTVTEMQNQGFDDTATLDDWYAQMIRILPNVDKNISLTGIYTPSGSTVFFKNAQNIGTIDDPQFGKWFFNIWLGQNTRVPKLRNQLLGE